jgi:hypothetical protein
MTTLTITPTGEVRFIWSDALQPLLALGKAVIRRASHVEPTAVGQWTADLSPVGGPLLGPFTFRQDALDAEVDWLANHGF